MKKGEKTNIDKASIESKLNELVDEIGTIPPTQPKKLAMLTKKSSNRKGQLNTNTESLQESLNYLRVSIKYLLFDLEATRRENNYLRKLVEGKGR